MAIFGNSIIIESQFDIDNKYKWLYELNEYTILEANNSDKIIEVIVNSTLSQKRLPNPSEINWLMRKVGYMKQSTIEQITSYYKNYAYEVLGKVNFKNNTLPLPEKESSYQLKKIHELISDKYDVNSKPSPEQTFSVFLNIKNPKDFDSIPDDNEIQELISYVENVERKDGQGICGIGECHHCSWVCE